MATELKWAVDDYNRMIEAGILAVRQVELLAGEIYEMTPESPSHTFYGGSLADRFRDHFGSRALVREVRPNKLANSEPLSKDLSMEAAMNPLKADGKILYETDYQQWIETTLEKLRSRNYASVDWENLIEEIEDMGRSERRSLESNLIVVLLHLLKWQYQPEHRSGSWAGSIVEHRRRLRKALKESPSLKPYLENVFAESYTEAVKQAKAETELPLEIFPPQCLYELSQVMDDEFFPQ